MSTPPCTVPSTPPPLSAVVDGDVDRSVNWLVCRLCVCVTPRRAACDHATPVELTKMVAVHGVLFNRYTKAIRGSNQMVVRLSVRLIYSEPVNHFLDRASVVESHVPKPSVPTDRWTLPSRRTELN